MKMVGLTEALFRLTITGKSPDAQNADPKNIQQNCPISLLLLVMGWSDG
jgi:hypothetical protein